MGLSERAEGEPLYLDTPENNAEALALAGRHGMKEVFGCARMVYGAGDQGKSAERRLWRAGSVGRRLPGITSFEMG